MKKSIVIVAAITFLSTAAMERIGDTINHKKAVTFALQEERISVHKKDRPLKCDYENPFHNHVNRERLNAVMQKIVMDHTMKTNTK